MITLVSFVHVLAASPQLGIVLLNLLARVRQTNNTYGRLIESSLLVRLLAVYPTYRSWGLLREIFENYFIYEIFNR